MTTDTGEKIRVLLVDDSPLVLVLLKRMLATSDDVIVVDTASNGQEALDKIPKLKPDIICTDLNMPVMNGMELTRRVMEQFPTPILVISTAVQKGDEDNVFELLRAGAVDVFPKPPGGLLNEGHEFARDLVSKIRVVCRVVVFTKHRHSASTAASPTSPAAPSELAGIARHRGAARIKITTIGASTGGPQAYVSLLSKLPANYPVPIVCVQHVGIGFLTGLVEWLDSQCALKVQVARYGEQARPGYVYFPEEDTHLEVSPDGILRSASAEPFHGFRPSATVLFESIARSFGEAGLGVLMTGMGDDGAVGLKAIHDAGGVTIAQDESTSTVFGMPREAIALGAARHVLPLPDIAPALCRILGL